VQKASFGKLKDGLLQHVLLRSMPYERPTRWLSDDYPHIGGCRPVGCEKWGGGLLILWLFRIFAVETFNV
jgi:hypothetical protein